ncbi:hypothetical protein [Marinomonas aquiplantarum]|uniref:Uncharacterized protein n=1 Tax=Marinomonas aquiplantarum TaxID=491951 RepID=A0A366D1W6_9GAMM|nr:hypothetical protein [Marinomonas aquiplantarum]RBO83915.1 hypothetical protein DFP76_103189 [Marinomonas aquiplantarum]
MKAVLEKLCSPILNLFEDGEGAYDYKPSHRKVLITLGVLCLVIGAISIYVTLVTGQFAGMIPIVLFCGTGLVCEVVGLLGSDRAVARIWKRN